MSSTGGVASAGRRGAALALFGALGLGTAACGGDGTDRSLSSSRPSAEVTVGRTATTAPAATRTTPSAAASRPARTQGTGPTTTTEPAKTAGPTEQAKTAGPTETAEPIRTVEPAETVKPAKTVAPTAAPTRTAETTRTAEATATSVAAVPVAAADESGAFLGWLLVILLFGGAIAVLLVNRSRRETAWDSQTAALAAATRDVTGGRLPPVLTAWTAGERALLWPPVRDNLIGLAGRWATLAATARDGVQEAGPNQISSLLQDLVTAIEGENEALAAGREWQALRPQVDAVRSALAAALPPQPAPAPAL
jgi:hypothetical protein